MIFTQKQARLVLRRLLLPLLVTFLLAVTANAYTLVMRNGRRVEIPDNFAVAPLTLTYEVSAGIQITVQLVAIDIPATERANNEPAGSLLRHTEKQVNSSDDKGENVQTTSTTSKRSITNSDLVAFRRARLESEVNYERRRKELGLPSIAESRRRAALDAEENFERLRQIRSEDRDSEDYWRSRASTLRSEIAANNARIGFVRARLDELPGSNSMGSYTSVYQYDPYQYDPTGRGRYGRRPQVYGNPGIFGTPTYGPQVGGRGYPNPNRGSRRYGGRSQYPYENAQIWNSPSQSYDSSFERSSLVTELDQLLGNRAELEARWRELEDEARRAGAAPGWLRP
jgi:hypothetical protein